MSEQVPRVVLASELVGDEVQNPAGERLGRIVDLMLDPASGQIAYALLALGGTAKSPDRLSAVPWSALRTDATENRFILEIDPRRLQDAPTFEPGDPPSPNDRRWQAEVYAFYGRQPYWEQPQHYQG